MCLENHIKNMFKGKLNTFLTHVLCVWRNHYIFQVLVSKQELLRKKDII